VTYPGCQDHCHKSGHYTEICRATSWNEHSSFDAAPKDDAIKRAALAKLASMYRSPKDIIDSFVVCKTPSADLQALVPRNTTCQSYWVLQYCEQERMYSYHRYNAIQDKCCSMTLGQVLPTTACLPIVPGAHRYQIKTAPDVLVFPKLDDLPLGETATGSHLEHNHRLFDVVGKQGIYANIDGYLHVASYLSVDCEDILGECEIYVALPEHMDNSAPVVPIV